MKKVILFTIILSVWYTLNAQSWAGKYDKIERSSEYTSLYYTYLYTGKNYKVGCCDENGRVILAPAFDHLFFEARGFISVETNGKWGLYDTLGRVIVAPIYEDIKCGYIQENGYIEVLVNSQWIRFQVASKNDKKIKNKTNNDELYIEYFKKGDAYFEKKNWKKSLKSYELAASYKETFAINYNIATCLYNRGKYKDAIQYYTRSLNYAQSQNDWNDAHDMIVGSIQAYQNGIRRQQERRQAVGDAFLNALVGVATATVSGGGGVPVGDPEYQAWINYRQSGLPGASTISFEDFKKANARAAANGYQIGNSQSSSSNPNSSTSSSSHNKCTFCNGTGMVVDNTAPTFGLDKTKYCDVCKKEVPLSHCHVQCPACKGKGYQ